MWMQLKKTVHVLISQFYLKLNLSSLCHQFCVHCLSALGHVHGAEAIATTLPPYLPALILLRMHVHLHDFALGLA